MRATEAHVIRVKEEQENKNSHKIDIRKELDTLTRT